LNKENKKEEAKKLLLNIKQLQLKQHELQEKLDSVRGKSTKQEVVEEPQHKSPPKSVAAPRKVAIS
jgi:hypothetical protein